MTSLLCCSNFASVVDCRWWGDQHHGNADACHEGLNLYVAATMLLLLGQLILMGVSVYFIGHSSRPLAEPLLPAAMMSGLTKLLFSRQKIVVATSSRISSCIYKRCAPRQASPGGAAETVSTTEVAGEPRQARRPWKSKPPPDRQQRRTVGRRTAPNPPKRRHGHK